MAQLVGTAAAHDADPGDAAEVRAITDAMVRLLIGAPLTSDGKLTVVFLAVEAGLRRNKLTHKHTGLKDLFYALVKARAPLPPRYLFRGSATGPPAFGSGMTSPPCCS